VTGHTDGICTAALSPNEVGGGGGVREGVVAGVRSQAQLHKLAPSCTLQHSRALLHPRNWVGGGGGVREGAVGVSGVVCAARCSCPFVTTRTLGAWSVAKSCWPPRPTPHRAHPLHSQPVHHLQPPTSQLTRCTPDPSAGAAGHRVLRPHRAHPLHSQPVRHLQPPKS